MVLSEKEITKRAIKYLREYYRFRDRHLDSFFEARTEQVTQSGIIADGLIRFKKTDGTYFVASIEATSIAKEEEIRYRRLNRLLLWDSAAAALLLTALLMAFLYYSQFLKTYYGDPSAFWSMAILSLMVFFGGAWLLLSRLRRYRYIYSIEQFRQYDVDEQWIAYDSSIFPDYGNKYHEEIKRQCLKWGIGLLQIDDHQVHPVMTPSREGEFGARKKADFFKGGTIIPKLSSKNFAQQIMRYRKGAFNQIFLLIGGLVILGVIFNQFNHESPYNYWDKERLVKQAELIDEIGPEENIPWVTPEFVVPFNRKVKPYLDKNVTIFVRQPQDSSKQHIAPKVFVLTDNQQVKKYSTPKQAASCKGIPGKPGDDFIIQFGAYKSMAHAHRRIKLLNRVGITADIYSCGCLGSNVRLNCVIYVVPYGNPEAAFKKMKTFQQLLTDKHIPVEEIWLRSVKEL